MRERLARYLLAVALTGALSASAGCDLLEPPLPSSGVAQQENVGVDPSGVDIDTSTVMPPDDSDQPLTAQAPPTQTAPQPKPAPPPPPPPVTKPPATNSGPAPSTLPNTGGSSGITHHRRAHTDRGSSDSGDNGDSGDSGDSGNSGNSGDSGD